MANNPNLKLAALLARSGSSHKGLARRFVMAAKAHGDDLAADHTEVRRWLDGVKPRGRKPYYIAEALSTALGEPVSVADIGMSYAEADLLGPDGVYPEVFADSITVLAEVLRQDLAQTPEARQRPVDPDLWSELVTRWFVDPDDEPGELLLAGGLENAIDIVQTTTEMFSTYDYKFGGGRPRLLVARVIDNEVLPTLKLVRPGPPQASEYLGNVGALVRVGAWSAYDVGDQWLAQAYFALGVRIAKAAGDRTLGARMFAGMSHQANFLGYHRAAIRLAQAAHEGFRDQGSPTAKALAWAMEARARAAMGQERDCESALTQAQAWHELRDGAVEPEWLRYFDESELNAEIAHCKRDLGKYDQASHHAQLSIKLSDSLYVRSLSFVHTVNATGVLLGKQHDIEQATAVARGVVDTAADQLRSNRVLAYLDEFRQRLRPFRDTKAVREFEEYMAVRLGRLDWAPRASRRIVLP